MADLGFTIIKVVAIGADKPDAALAFGPGLNVVAGASNTGKTYGWQLIDFLLGASTPPKTVALGTGYARAMIEIQPRVGPVTTLSRSLSGGDAIAYAASIDEIEAETRFSLLAEKHDGNNHETISAWLLTMSGLWRKQIRKNEFGEKRSLSFRDVAWLTLVDEVRIITERSPVLSGQYTSPTEEKSAFGLFLTGVDDAAIATQQKPKDRKLRIETELAVLQSLLDDRESRLGNYRLDLEQLHAQRGLLASAISEATALITTQQFELDREAKVRDAAWTELQALDSRMLFRSEQIKRLKLLKDHYASDTARLESALEAGELLERLPDGACPVCGHLPTTDDDVESSDAQLSEFQQACRAELVKIATSARDLDVSLGEMNAEQERSLVKARQLQDSLAQSNATIAELLDVKIGTANGELTKLLAQQAVLSEAAFTANEVVDLRARYSSAEQKSKVRVSRPKIAKKVQAAGMAEFCKVVETTLRAWKFPFAGTVSWSDDNFDLVVGGENRGGMGKGFRAVTHAAFSIALMRYCRTKGLPHPGIVILDTPLNPYKGADKTEKDEANLDLQEAFYFDLAQDTSGDQVIVFENTEPPISVRDRMRYTHFSGNPVTPRSGFFPVPRSG